MKGTAAVNFHANAENIFGRLEAVEKEIEGAGFDRLLHHLVKLRASQINQCAFCVRMHIEEARKDGESQDRIDRVVVWRHVRDFTPAEKAALAWTEALTEPDPKADLGPLRRELREHFTEREISTLTAIVAMINLWNRIQISNH
ncbi:MAG: carboxymuconolactone decarboxylase family protein [Nisaea sp.]|uniref:carboxymuconolactone decarboxylase family protein n=1 Tax=Nisaea sp. TaxID=2024842 RepID=UPI001B1988E4|nr:carboxymuconolactone decarboxylase family protein [Nisaea sp.]MBO6562107.1 carboxymuconolactone decarboxylase family protein [Nisaea sp.]